MFNTISVLIPTRGRPARLRLLLDTYSRTAVGSSSELVFRVDDDDIETQALLKQQPWTVVIGPRLQGYRSMPTFFNELAAAASGDVLICGNDDMVFATPQWPSLILAKANEFPDGLFNIGVRTFNSGAFPFSTVSRLLVETLGFIWDPRIFWGDIFLRDIMMTLQRAVELPSVYIDHDWMGHHPDNTYTEGHDGVMEGGAPYWNGIHAIAVQEAVEKLRSRIGVAA